MGQTTNFGLEKFGSEGSISQNGYKFSSKDRETLDSLIYTLFNHDHRTTDATPINDPSRPTLAAGSSGNFLAGTTLFYKVSFRDSQGNETAASSEQSVALDPPLTAPAAPTLATAATGGILEAGTYRYSLSYYQSAGGETTAQNVNSIIATTATSENTITLPALPAAADGWKLYRKGPNDANYFYLAQIAGGATPPTEYVDDGSVLANCTVYRPTRNTTNGSNSVTVSLNANDLPLDSRITSWRVYRTTASGSYPSSSLVATVTSTTTESGTDLVTSYVDTGSSLLPGVPLSVSVTPPAIPQLNASDVFSALSGRLPKELAPPETRTFTAYAQALSSEFLTLAPQHQMDAIIVPMNVLEQTLDARIGLFRAHTTDAIAGVWQLHTTDAFIVPPLIQGMQGRDYVRTVPTVDMPIERMDIYFMDSPYGLDANNYVRWIIDDGTTKVWVDAQTDTDFFSWVSSGTDSGQQEAEDIVGVDGVLVNDLLATNDVAQELQSQNDTAIWDTGNLEEGDYIAYFYVRDMGQTTGTLSLVVRTTQATPVTLASTTLSPGPTFYEPAQELAFSVPAGGIGVEIVATKTDNGSDYYRIDKMSYEYQNPTLLEGSTVRIYSQIYGSPGYTGDKANITVWY